jgi:hypothetical protein
LADCRSADSDLADWHGTTKSKEGQKEKKYSLIHQGRNSQNILRSSYDILKAGEQITRQGTNVIIFFTSVI